MVLPVCLESLQTVQFSIVYIPHIMCQSVTEYTSFTSVSFLIY